jgi:hypothetical protein
VAALHLASAEPPLFRAAYLIDPVDSTGGDDEPSAVEALRPLGKAFGVSGARLAGRPPTCAAALAPREGSPRRAAHLQEGHAHLPVAGRLVCPPLSPPPPPRPPAAGIVGPCNPEDRTSGFWDAAGPGSWRETLRHGGHVQFCNVTSWLVEEALDALCGKGNDTHEARFCSSAGARGRFFGRWGPERRSAEGGEGAAWGCFLLPTP